MARSFDGVSRTISVIPTGPVYGRASILLRRILALLRRSLVVRGALLRVFMERCSGCFQDCQKTKEQGSVPLPPSYERPYAPEREPHASWPRTFDFSYHFQDNNRIII